jgi:hypothetical protein
MSKPQQLPYPERLKNGAKILGQLWKDLDQRCPMAWSLDNCTCQPLKKFCQGRLKWLTLAVEAGRELQEDQYGIVLTMTASEWDATGLTLKLDHPGVGMILVGSGSDSVTGMVDMAKMMDAPEVLESTLRVMKAFPRSKVDSIEDVSVAAHIALEPALTVEPEIEANPDEAFE